jgi:hypothetical protein
MRSSHIIINYNELQHKHPELAEDERFEESMQFLYFPDNAFFNEDLAIDKLNDYDGIIIVGNLEVNGRIANYNGEGGATLIVFGDVYADTLIAGGSFIDLKKTTHIKSLCLTHYNHGTLLIKKLYCTLLISEQYGEMIRDYSNVEFVFKDNYFGAPKENEYYLSELYEIFKDKPWISFNNDYSNPDYYFYDYSEHGFSAYKFIEYELIKGDHIDSLIERVKEVLTQRKRDEKLLLQYESSDTRQLYKIICRKFIWLMDYQSLGLKRDTNVKVYNSDLELDHDLILDTTVFAKENISTIFIDGSLKVNGSIYNSSGTEGIQLFVSGDVYCHNLIVSAAQIYINNTLTVENILYCTYPNILEYTPKLKVWKIISAKLAIIEHSYELKHVLGENLNHKVYTVSEDKKEDHFVIDQLKNILDEKYWSIDNKYLIEDRLFQAIIRKDNIFKPDFEVKVANVLNKKKQRKNKDGALKESIIDMIQCIKSFLQAHSLDYQEQEGKLRITGQGVSFSIYYKPTMHSLSFGPFADRSYGKKKLYNFKNDLIHYLEKYLLNQVRTIDYVKNEEFLGDVLQVFQDNDWVVALDDKNIYSQFSKMKNVKTTINTNQFILDKDETLKLIEELNK